MDEVSEAIYQCTGRCLIEARILDDRALRGSFSGTSLMFVWKLPISETPVVECMGLGSSSATADGSSSHINVGFAINVNEEVSLLLNIEGKPETDVPNQGDIWFLLALMLLS